jgi:hypothetical protein
VSGLLVLAGAFATIIALGVGAAAVNDWIAARYAGHPGPNGCPPPRPPRPGRPWPAGWASGARHEGLVVYPTTHVPLAAERAVGAAPTREGRAS